MTVSINPPKTPVTKGSVGVATATIPNVCKMPGPPAPFVPAPLPNIGKSGDSPKGYSKKVKIEGKTVAIKGATFKSMGDVASKGTGGGLVSANTHGPTKFVGPGSLDTKIEGKNVQLLGDPMLNNCGGSGSLPNSATLVGVLQGPGMIAVYGDEACPLCGEAHGLDGRLEESKDTQGAVSQLEAAIDAALAAASTPGMGDAVVDLKNAIKDALVGAAQAETKAERKPFHRIVSAEQAAQRGAVGLSAMLGAVECKCKKVYAGTSNVQYRDVLNKVPFHAPNPYHTLAKQPDKDTFKTRRYKEFAAQISGKHQDKFRALWQEYKVESLKSRKNLTDEMAYPPGSCAAQLMVLLAMDHACRPIGLTERLYSSKGTKLKKLKVRDMTEDGPGPARDATPAELCGDRPIPPCKTCQVILQALMCTDDEGSLKCDHKKPKKKVCYRC